MRSARRLEKGIKMKIAVTKFARVNYPFIDMDILLKKCENADLIKSHLKFCRYISLPVRGLESSIVPITNENRHLLVSGYLTRKNDAAKELPYLSRWFEKGTVSPVPAKSVTVILYNRDQLALEKTVVNAPSPQGAGLL